MKPPRITVTTSLEDIRRMRFETQAEYLATIGVSRQTYRRMLRRDPKIEPKTMRQVAERLGVQPHLIAEFVPQASAARLAALDEVIAAADAAGWLRLEADGSLTPISRST